MKSGTFTWMKEVEKAFEEMKRHLTNAPILLLLYFNIPFELYVDALKIGIGVVLSFLEESYITTHMM